MHHILGAETWEKLQVGDTWADDGGKTIFTLHARGIPRKSDADLIAELLKRLGYRSCVWMDKGTRSAVVSFDLAK